MIFKNADDSPAGGTIIGLSPLGMLAPGESKQGRFAATLKGDPRAFPILTLMADWGQVVGEANEANNFAAVGIGVSAEYLKSLNRSPSDQSAESP